MTAAWIASYALWALWLSAVAWIAERLLRTARVPLRFVWLSAMVLSVLGPIIAYSLQRPETALVASVPPSGSTILSQPTAVQASAPAARVDAMITLRTIAERADRSLWTIWIGTSIVFLAYLAGGILRLRIVRRRWQSRVVAGTPVLISEDTGPALVGVVAPSIFIPTWALALEPDALRLMLRHELEHRSAGDTRTLALAQTLLALMPWNVLLWWQLRRLRLAIELDCDARVLRATNDVATYGRLLLEAANGGKRGAQNVKLRPR